MIDEGDELAEVEALVAHRRQELREAMSAWLRDRREAAVSPKGLLGAAAAGLLIGLALRRRQRQVAPANPAPSTAEKALGLVGGLAMSLVRMRYGNPLHALLNLMQNRHRSPQADDGIDDDAAPPTATPPAAPHGLHRHAPLHMRQSPLQ